MSTRTLLIGLDGATFTILDPLLRQGVMPFLQTLLNTGARAELMSVIPPLTPPAWTSLVTGRSPGNHGIFDFMRFEQAASGRYLRIAESGDVGCETVWSIASRHGLRCTVLNFPLMYPPPRIRGSIVPGWVPWRHLRLACHPVELYDTLKALPGFNARELAMDMALEGRALEGCHDEADYHELITLHIRRERQWCSILRHRMRTDPCELTAVLFDGVDKLQHICWRFLDPALFPAEPSPMEMRIRELCLDYFREIDCFLAEIVDLAGPAATTIIASDHGFGATTEVFHVNAWLQQQGYLAWAEAAHSDAGHPGPQHAETLGMATMARRFYEVDWDRTRAYCPTPSGNGIYLSQPRTGQAAAPEDPDFRHRLIADLLSLTDPASGEAVVTRIWTREEAFAGNHMASAPDLTLQLRDGGFASILPSNTLLKARPEPTGTHRPIGIFIAAGPGVRRGVSVPALSILDVAPTLLYTLGLAIPEDFEGVMPEQIFQASHILAHPIVRGAPTRQAAAAPAATIAPEMEAEVVKQLKALGYME